MLCLESTPLEKVSGLSMPWILGARPAPLARVRLFCFPYAGASAAIFRSWTAQLDQVEICAVQLPGRGGRLRERPYTQLRQLASAACEGLQTHLSPPFALFGHSFGGLLAFEVARELRRRGVPGPEHLFISTRRGPRLPEIVPHLHALQEAAFVSAVRARYGCIPAEVLNEPELLQLLLPALRADFEALETYAYEPDAPLACPITTFGGTEDPWATLGEIEAWRHETSASFALTRFPGGHFYFQHAEGLLVKELASRLAPAALAGAQTRQ